MMSLFFPTLDGVNKVSFLPAISFLLMEFTSFRTLLGFQELALIHVVFLGVFIEVGRVMEQTMSVEKGYDSYSSSIRPSIAILLFISGIPIVLGLIGSFVFLWINMDKISASKLALFLLYNSILLAEAFIISNLISGVVLDIEGFDLRELKKLSTKEKVEYVRDEIL